MSSRLRSEIITLRDQITRLDGEQARQRGALHRALAAEFYNEHDVSNARHALATIERQRGHAQDRLTALEAQLPSPEAVAAAQARAVVLVEQATDAGEAGVAAFADLLAGLEQCEPSARRLIAARRAAAHARLLLADLSQTYDLRIAPASIPTPSKVDADLAQHLAMLLADVTMSGEPRDTVELYLQAARTARAS